MMQLYSFEDIENPKKINITQSTNNQKKDTKSFFSIESIEIEKKPLIFKEYSLKLKKMKKIFRKPVQNEL